MKDVTHRFIAAAQRGFSRVRQYGAGRGNHFHVFTMELPNGRVMRTLTLTLFGRVFAVGIAL